MKDIFLVFPTIWDEKQLASCAESWNSQYRVHLLEPSDVDCPWNFDILGFINQALGGDFGRIDGVFSSSDYPGATVAGAIATRLGLPGPRPEKVMECSHKYYSRLRQRQTVPAATAQFNLIHPKDESTWTGIPYPFFIKPVKGAFSMMARVIQSQVECSNFLSRDVVDEFLNKFLHIFNTLVAHFTEFELNGNYFLAEEILHGRQVTVEGFSSGDDVEIFGIVDSILHPETKSFICFEYPSSLPRSVQERMEETAIAIIRGIPLKDTMFNIEMIYDEHSDRITIVEINPRICGQFADLYQKVDGMNSYEIALAISSGTRPEIRRRRGPFSVAASFPMRVFEPVCVEEAPAPEDLAGLENEFPGTLLWSECSPGQMLADFAWEDGRSCRYGVTNVGAADHESLHTVLNDVTKRLGFKLIPAGH